MSIRTRTEIVGLDVAIAGQRRELEVATFRGMEDAAHALKERLRAQVRAAGMGDRLANTWRDRTYPQRKRASLHPTGLVWSNAPDIISFYAGDEREIVPVNGHRYLAIPTPTARAITGRKNSRLTVPEVLARLGGKTAMIKGKKGHLLLMWDARSAAGRRRGATREWILIYTLVPMIRSQKRFDVEASVEATLAELPDLVAERLDE